MSAYVKLGHKVFILIIRPEHTEPRIRSFKENGLDVTEIHPPSSLKIEGKRGLGKYINYLACFPTVSKIAKEIIAKNKIDYVYSYMPGIGSSVPAIRVKSKHKLKLVLDFADLHVYVRPKRIADSAFKEADKILAITEYLKNELTSKAIEKNKIHILPNGVDLDLFDPIKYNQEEIQKLRSGFGADKIVMFVGALQDLNLIINSAEKVTKELSSVKYVIIGDHRDPARSKDVWKHIVKEKGLEKYFEFLGKKPRDEITKYLLAADICLDSFPDEPYYAAAHPIKLLEYGACQKAVVATRVSETEKIIKHGVFGLLANPNNPAEYANHMLTLLNSSEMRLKMGKAFSDYVHTNFGWNKIASDLQTILQN